MRARSGCPPTERPAPDSADLILVPLTTGTPTEVVGVPPFHGMSLRPAVVPPPRRAALCRVVASKTSARHHLFADRLFHPRAGRRRPGRRRSGGSYSARHGHADADATRRVGRVANRLHPAVRG